MLNIFFSLFYSNFLSPLKHLSLSLSLSGCGLNLVVFIAASGSWVDFGLWLWIQFSIPIFLSYQYQTQIQFWPRFNFYTFFVAHSKQSKIQYNSSLLQCWAYFFLVGSYKSFCILAHLVSRLCLDHQILFYNNSNSLVQGRSHLAPAPPPP